MFATLRFGFVFLPIDGLPEPCLTVPYAMGIRTMKKLRTPIVNITRVRLRIHRRVPKGGAGDGQETLSGHSMGARFACPWGVANYLR